MSKEWTKTAIVQDGGVVEVVLPELHGGEEVEVIVRSKGNQLEKTKRPGFGSARGQVYMSDDFDEPLDDFKDYT